MHLDPKSTVADVPVLAVRDLLRRLDLCTTDAIAAHLQVPLAQAVALREELLARSLIARAKASDAGEWYEKTLAGRRFAVATAAPMLPRARAEARLAACLDRVRVLNADPQYVLRVRRVLLFGSMLGRAKLVSDIDLVLELEPRPCDHAERETRWAARVAAAEAHGRRFRSWRARLNWPEDEVRAYIKQRSRTLHIQPHIGYLPAGTRVREIYPPTQQDYRVTKSRNGENVTLRPLRRRSPV